MTPDALGYAVTESISRIEAAWKDLKQRGHLVPGSVITVRLLPTRPLYSLAVCDDLSIIQITAVTGRVGADVDYYYFHHGNRGDFPSSWLASQIQRIDQAPIRFNDEILK